MEPLAKALNSVNEVVENIASATCKSTDAICEKSEQFKSAEQQFIKNCQGYIRENPVRSLGLAVAAGFVFSRLLSGR